MLVRNAATARRLDKTLTTEALLFRRRSKSFETFYNTCCAFDRTRVNPTAFSGPVGFTGQIVVEGRDDCTFEWVDVTDSASYSSTQTAVATVGATTGTAHGVGVGTATLRSHLDYDRRPFKGAVYCVAGTLDDDTPTTVAPIITSISPSKGLIGATTVVVINGRGFGLSPSVQAGTGITVTVNGSSDTQISTHFSVAGTAPGGNHSVTVTAGGQTSNAVNFFVQVPTSLFLVGTNAQGPASCPPGSVGWARNVTWQLKDQGGADIQRASILMADQIAISTTQNTCGGSDLPPLF